MAKQEAPKKLGRLYEAIRDKGIFLSNLVKSQRLSKPFEKLQDAYVQNAKQSIHNYVQDTLASYEKLASGTNADPRKLAYIAGAVKGFQYFQPFIALTEANFDDQGSYIKYLITSTYKDVDPKKLLGTSVPTLLLDKFVGELEKIECPETQYKVFKFLVNSKPILQGVGPCSSVMGPGTMEKE